MNKATTDIIKAIADDVLALSRLILDDSKISDNVKVRKNTLANSKLKNDIEVKTAFNTNDTVITALFNNYITFIEWTRPKEHGKQPPLDTLRDWAIEKGIPTDNSTLFLIARAIWRDGHEGRPILATLDQEVQSEFNDEWFDKLFNTLIDDLTKYFS